MNIGDLGFAASLGLAAFGSALGAMSAGAAAIGGWKKCFAQNRAAPFMLIAFVGAPLTQTIYGMILMNAIRASGVSSIAKLGAGLFGGLALGGSAWFQGVAGAHASDAMAETGKGFGNFIMVLGLVETTAIFTMVFMMGAIG
ncbi:MAG: V-type ATP synthase subunit K [Spirochaetes bacterium RBG_16_67_19]|nr:MAG: V-type ATP synthase subunit K [Spirochaetes bacterium RBG_16_67_19]